MVKRWLAKCKAEIKATDSCYKKGYFHIEVLSCKEMSEKL